MNPSKTPQHNIDQDLPRTKPRLALRFSTLHGNFTPFDNFALDNGSCPNYHAAIMTNPRQAQHKPPTDTRSVVGQIARIREQANLLIVQELRDRSIPGLLPAHGAVLVYLFRQRQPVPIKDVVKNVGRVKSTVTGMLNTLEQLGYVRRTPSDTDGRVILVELTASGRALKPDFERISEKLMDRLYASMPRHDRETLVRLLSELERNLAEAK